MTKRHTHPSIASMLSSYEKSGYARFHMPGHKGVFDAPSDVTELSVTDDLYFPSGAILALEKRLERAYGARRSFPLVNGSTGGILAMMLSLGREKRVLLSRTCHRSAIHAIALCGHNVSFMAEETPQAVDAALCETPADAVFITSPAYDGVCRDVKGIADVSHAHGALLFVDAAHGAHFPFAPSLPQFPADVVDMWCVSAHKTLDALTQTAILHLGAHCPFSVEDVERALFLSSTSSPSFLLMASLERALDNALKENRWEAHVLWIREIRSKIAGMDGLLLNDAPHTDITRLCIDVSERNITGYAAQKHLVACGVMPEMADMSRVVLITTPSDREEWYARLLDALASLPHEKTALVPLQAPDDFGALHISVRDAMLGDTAYVPLKRAGNRIAAGPVGIYPPGNAVIFPGERITFCAIEYLTRCREAGAVLSGLYASRVPCVRMRDII